MVVPVVVRSETYTVRCVLEFACANPPGLRCGMLQKYPAVLRMKRKLRGLRGKTQTKNPPARRIYVGHSPFLWSRPTTCPVEPFLLVVNLTPNKLDVPWDCPATCCCNSKESGIPWVPGKAPLKYEEKIFSLWELFLVEGTR